MNQRRMLWRCTLTRLSMTIILITLMIIFGSTTYIRTWGPHERLAVAGVVINTWSKYSILIVCIAVYRILSAIVSDFGGPIISFNIFDPNRKTIIGFKLFELWTASAIMSFMSSIGHIFEIQLTITQFDLALIQVIFSEIAFMFTTFFLLQKKTFEPSVKGPSEDTEINILFDSTLKMLKEWTAENTCHDWARPLLASVKTRAEALSNFLKERQRTDESKTPLVSTDMEENLNQSIEELHYDMALLYIIKRCHHSQTHL